MMYPFLQLNDLTEITHSQMLENGEVKVYVETPHEKDGFHNAFCYLPAYRWEDVNGYTNEEIAYFEEIIRSTAHLIIEFSQQGGFENAAGF